MRCPKGTRKNKKNGKCEPPREPLWTRCKNGYHRDSMGICRPLVRSRIQNYLDTPNSAYRGRNVQPTGTSEHFIALCKKHILVDHLAGVLATTWMQKGDCNIFFVGEQHKPYTNTKCSPIVEMFKSLMKENENSANPVQIDIMLEFLQDATKYVDRLDGKLKHSQMSRMRHFLAPCMTRKNCSVRVHWTDPTLLTSDKNPKWLTALGNQKYYDHFGTDKWKEHDIIRAELQSKDDVIKILTKNVVAMKEIDRANEVDPEFKDYAFFLFNQLFQQTVDHANGEWEKCVLWYLRRVMDFYTCARIVKGNMKNIIVYAGNSHTTTMIHFLQMCQFSIVESIRGNCR